MEHFYRVMDAATNIRHANINNSMQIAFSQECYYVFKLTLTGGCMSSVGMEQAGHR